jgi:hypothetical protein
MDDQTARVIGGIYIAFSSALTDEGARLVHDTLLGIADHPHTSADDQQIYRTLVDCATAH